MQWAQQWHGTGIIPARAGFTQPGYPSDELFPDHPRSRGVYCDREHGIIVFWGSSPLARGLRTTLRRSPGQSRIIPARAGFTSRLTACPTCFSGSSPLARGLPPQGPAPAACPGIIPARAGFTNPMSGLTGGTEDHPRSRGVYPDPAQYVTRKDGSSPLARGLRSRAPTSILIERIIPARAGFTGPGRWSVRFRPDHPRSRGVYSFFVRGMVSPRGSSPLARGLLPRGYAVARRARIIPARAGFTSGGLSVGLSRSDHPRSRGVYKWVANNPGPGEGSSPLARGLPTRTDHH